MGSDEAFDTQLGQANLLVGLHKKSPDSGRAGLCEKHVSSMIRDEVNCLGP